MWRSLVAHSLWERRVAGSNPVIPTRVRGFASRAPLTLLHFSRGPSPRTPTVPLPPFGRSAAAHPWPQLTGLPQPLRSPPSRKLGGLPLLRLWPQLVVCRSRCRCVNSPPRRKLGGLPLLRLWWQLGGLPQPLALLDLPRV